MAYVAEMGSSLQSTPDSIIYGTPEEVSNFVGGHSIHDFFYPRSRPPFTGIIIDKVEILFGMSRTCECVSIFLCVQGLKCHLFFPRFTSNYPTRKSKC